MELWILAPDYRVLLLTEVSWGEEEEWPRHVESLENTRRGGGEPQGCLLSSEFEDRERFKLSPFLTGALERVPNCPLNIQRSS